MNSRRLFFRPRASDVSVGRIHDVLTSLETRSLVRIQSASRPKKYVAVEPEGIFAVNDLTDADFAARVDETFRPRWAEATPLDPQ